MNGPAAPPGEKQAANGPPALFDAVLYPHRSLSPLGFWLVMAAVAGLSFTAGLAFFIAGAWPVVGFFGLDVLLVYAAFRMSYRSARLTEFIRLDERELVVRRVSPRGRVATWRFQPFWARVAIDEAAGGDARLVIASHGRSVAVGDFLVAEERIEVAHALRAALARLRETPLSP